MTEDIVERVEVTQADLVEPSIEDWEMSYRLNTKHELQTLEQWHAYVAEAFARFEASIRAEYAGEPVVVIGHNWALHWASTDNLKAIVERTGIEIGTYLYAHPPREAPDTAAELGYPDLGPKHPLQMDKEERAKWEDRLKAAYCIQQKEVPDQTALVWRDDLITQHYEAIRLRAWTASLEAQLAEARAEVERLREALRVIDAKLCEVSGTRPKREPQAWCDAATFIEDTVTAALAQKGGGDADA